MKVVTLSDSDYFYSLAR